MLSILLIGSIGVDLYLMVDSSPVVTRDKKNSDNLLNEVSLSHIKTSGLNDITSSFLGRVQLGQHMQ